MSVPPPTRSRRRSLAPRSLRGRVTAVVLVLLAVMLVALFTVVDLSLGARLRADLRTRLDDRVALATQLDGTLDAQALVDKLRGDGVSAQLCSTSTGCVSAATVPPPPRPPTGGRAAPDTATTATAPTPTAAPAPARPVPASASAPHPVGAAPAVRHDGSTLYVRASLADGSLLTLSTEESAVPAALHRLLALEVVAGAGTLVVAGLVLGRLVGVALRPLETMTVLARDIASGDRGRRLGPSSSGTELDRTAAAFDAMVDELEDAAASARAEQARMRAFLSDASHELRTPLASLQAQVEDVLLTDPDRPRREQALAAVVRDSARTARLLDDLLTVTRLEERHALRPEPCDLAVIAREEAARYELLAPQVRWRVLGPPSLGVVADPLRIAQALRNVLDNAGHVSAPGGTVTLTLRDEAAAATSDTAGPADPADPDDPGGHPGRAVLDVTDEGPGVPPADRERIFDRLVRLDASRSRRTGGAGLGLPIARAIARGHGGDLLAVPSTAPRGACFRLSLPVGGAPQRA